MYDGVDMAHDRLVESLKAFEADIAEEFNAGKIRAPVHLSGGNEEQLIDVFKDVRPEDWVCGSWRMHYHCLLKGVPPEKLKAEIMAGRSMTLSFPEHRIISSAIVGGILPIAVGLAMAIRRAGGANHVWAFVGDMTARTGIFHECRFYADCQDLPITFVMEDNGISVCTDTKDAWGRKAYSGIGRVRGYYYTLGWPHAGAGKRVQF